MESSLRRTEKTHSRFVLVLLVGLVFRVAVWWTGYRSLLAFELFRLRHKIPSKPSGRDVSIHNELFHAKSFFASVVLCVFEYEIGHEIDSAADAVDEGSLGHKKSDRPAQTQDGRIRP